MPRTAASVEGEGVDTVDALTLSAVCSAAAVSKEEDDD